MLVLDEAHHLAGRVDKASRRILSCQYLPARRRLFMTATPRASEEPAGGTSRTAGGMDDTSVFGPVLGTYSFARGIAEGYLRDYRIAVIGVPDSQARQLLSARGVDYLDAPGRQSLQTAAAQVALGLAHRQFAVRRVLTFHPRVEAAAEFARTLPATVAQAGGITRPYAAHVHGGMDQRTRSRILKHLVSAQEQWSVVSSARCLGEGVDLPAVDAVLFAHTKESAVDITQAVGRALRPDPDRPGLSTVIVPLIVPDQDGEIGDLDPGDFATLWEVVRALRAHDDTLSMALDAAPLSDPEALTASGPQLPGKISVMLPTGTSQAVLTQIRLLLVRTTSSVWWRNYLAARAYYEEHGHLLARADYRTSDGVRLGAWLVQHRHAYRRGQLSAERIAHLTAIGMQWDPAAAAFATGLAAATAHSKQHGSLRVHPAYRTPDGFPLGQWLINQRNARQQGRASATPERVAALTQLGMEWLIDRPAEAWAVGLASARAYHRKTGDLDVPFTYRTPDTDYPLGRWIQHMRQKHKKGVLDARRKRRLDKLGMIWDKQEATWRKMYAAAVAYHRDHGTLDMRADHVTDEGLRLGRWIQTQRAVRNGTAASGKLTPSRIKALDALGMRWHHFSRTPSPAAQ